MNNHLDQEVSIDSKETFSEKLEDKAEVMSYNEDMGVSEPYNYKEDPDNPMNWPKPKKTLTILLISANAFMGYFTASVYMPATNDIRIEFDTNLTTINATIALFLLMNAIAPLIMAPLSERIGRRPVYTYGMLLYTVCSVVCGVSTNLGLFFAFRLLQGIFACTGQAIGGGSVSDIFEPHERGKAMSIYILATIIGPAIAPMIGGYIDQYLNWHWIFYILTILGGVLTICNFLFLKETLYIPNSKKLPPPTSFKERLERLKFNPLLGLKLLIRPEIGLSALPISIAFGWFYFLVTIIPQTYTQVFGFPTGTIGLCYLAGGIGNGGGSIVAGLVSDRLYARSTRRNNGVAVKEARLWPMYAGIPFFTIGSILYGWFLEIPVHWFGVLVMYTSTTFGIMFTITICSTYLVDSNPTKAASVVSSTNFTRNMCGMILSLTAVQIRGSMGDGWSYTLFGIMCVISYLICIPLVQKFGGRWRERP